MISKLIYITFFLSFLHSNEIDLIIDKILMGKNNYSSDDLLLEFSNIEDSDNDYAVLILKGLMDTDGEKSYEHFKNYIDNNSKQKYEEIAMSKISEYYYIRGLYIKSSYWYKKLINKYPNSKNLEPNINYFLNSLSVSGKLDSAKYYSKILHDKYPDLKFNSKFYNNINAKNNKKEKIKKSNDIGYSVEVSLYETYGQAMSVKSILSSEGFLSRIDEISINNKIMYALRIGSYEERKTAENIKKRIRSRLGLSNLVVIEIKL